LQSVKNWPSVEGKYKGSRKKLGGGGLQKGKENISLFSYDERKARANDYRETTFTFCS
jgi:hypothetical protein